MIRTTKLTGGPLVISESVPDFASVSAGIWVPQGSASEPADKGGLAHFIEHLLFKGTATRSARELAELIEDVGGQVNAYTAKEYSCFYAKVRAGDLPVALDVLGDMLVNSRFSPDDIERERSVVLDELRTAEDDPGDIVHDLFCRSIWPTSPLGRSILGERDSIVTLTRDDVVGFVERGYGPDQAMVVAAGAVDHDRLLTLVAQRLHSGTANEDGVGPALAELALPDYRQVHEYHRRPTEQVHLCLGGQAFSITDPDVYALEVANIVIGGGASSRLFQEVREERGLAYDIYSYTSCHQSGGLFAVYAGTSPESVGAVLKIIRDELEAARGGAVTAREVERAKAQMSAGLTFSLESSGSRASRLGKSRLYLGRCETVAEAEERIQAVTIRDVERALDRVLATPLSLIGVGAPAGEAAWE